MERGRRESSETEIAADKCPACDRGFESLFDFPVVQITALERTPIPSDLILPEDWEIFVDPEAKSGNRKVPSEVKALFDDETVVKGRVQYGNGTLWRDTVEYEGWQWSRIKYGDEGHYNKAKILLGGGIIIASAVEPYLSRLENLVNKLIVPSELEPPEIQIDFPEGTPLSLSKNPLDFVGDSQRDLKRNASLVVHSIHGIAAGNTLMSRVAQVASISYEGRVYK